MAKVELKELPYAERFKDLLKGDSLVADAATRCPRSTPRASMTFGRPGLSSATMATRQPHRGERLVAWADRSGTGADVLVPWVDWAFAAADAQPVFARGDCSTAANRLACRAEGPPRGLSARTHQGLGHNIPTRGIMRRYLDINPQRRGLILTFTVECANRRPAPYAGAH